MLLAGCSGEPPTPLYADYLWRLGNVIDADAPELAAVVAPPLATRAPASGAVRCRRYAAACWSCSSWRAATSPS